MHAVVRHIAIGIVRRSTSWQKLDTIRGQGIGRLK